MTKITASPLAYACPHVATLSEQHRDPMYQSCAAMPGEPCLWARRWDGFSDPAFHSERLEIVSEKQSDAPVDTDEMREAVLATGFV